MFVCRDSMTFVLVCIDSWYLSCWPCIDYCNAGEHRSYAVVLTVADAFNSFWDESGTLQQKCVSGVNVNQASHRMSSISQVVFHILGVSFMFHIINIRFYRLLSMTWYWCACVAVRVHIMWVTVLFLDDSWCVVCTWTHHTSWFQCQCQTLHHWLPTGHRMFNCGSWHMGRSSVVGELEEKWHQARIACVEFLSFKINTLIVNLWWVMNVVTCWHWWKECSHVSRTHTWMHCFM